MFKFPETKPEEVQTYSEIKHGMIDYYYRNFYGTSQKNNIFLSIVLSNGILPDRDIIGLHIYRSIDWYSDSKPEPDKLFIDLCNNISSLSTKLEKIFINDYTRYMEGGYIHYIDDHKKDFQERLDKFIEGLDIVNRSENLFSKTIYHFRTFLKMFNDIYSNSYLKHTSEHSIVKDDDVISKYYQDHLKKVAAFNDTK